MQAQKIIVVTEASMEQSKLYNSMKFAPKSKLAALQASINEACDARETFESKVERRLADGSFVFGQSADIKHVQALKDNDAVTRLFYALKVDPARYVTPMLQVGGKSSNETSNLKAYKKTREIAELVWSGHSTIENVVKVFTVCAFKCAEGGVDVLKRDFAENFLSSREFRSINQGSADLWSAIDDIRAKHMTSGAQTQASQAIRTLVALHGAEDVRDGRAKNTRILSGSPLMQALMRRFGQVTDTATTDADNDAPESVEQVQA